MKMTDTTQVLLANGGATATMFTECNQVLTFISLGLAISFTIYKFYKLSKK